MKYKFIEDLPTNWDNLPSGRLGALETIWRDQSKKMADSEAHKTFNEKLYRRWAIETGIIENIYTLDRGTTEVLVEQGFLESMVSHGATNKPVKFVIDTLKAHRGAIDFLFDFVKNNRTLSSSYIKELHALLATTQDSSTGRDQLGRQVEIPMEKGKWKTLPNNPTRLDGTTHQYCPPEHVDSEIDNLLYLHKLHLNINVPAVIEAAWLHHRFTQIHPFQDGNGRVARALASLVFIKAGLFPLVIHRDERSKYIEALEKADKGDLAPFVHLLESIQQSEIKKALSLASEVEREQAQTDLISAIGTKLQARKANKYKELIDKSREIADKLANATHSKLHETAEMLNTVFINGEAESEYHADAFISNEANDYWFRNEIINIAKRNEYFADTKTYRRWARIIIKNGTKFNIFFSFHCLGYEFSGTMCISSFAFEIINDDREKETTPIPLTSDIFIYTHDDEFEKIKTRYDDWLEDALLVGLAQFKETI